MTRFQLTQPGRIVAFATASLIGELCYQVDGDGRYLYDGDNSLLSLYSQLMRAHVLAGQTQCVSYSNVNEHQRMVLFYGEPTYIEHTNLYGNPVYRW